MKQYKIFNRLTYFSPCNIYPDAEIGEDCKVGMFAEVGRCRIGNRVTIGAMSFICEGVTIEDDVWIGPAVTFTNDRFPPSKKEEWGKTIIRKGARIGAGCVILCGHPGGAIEIGEGALIGAGSVVTKSVPAGETWCGNPARPLGIHSDGEPEAKRRGRPKKK